MASGRADGDGSREQDVFTLWSQLEVTSPLVVPRREEMERREADTESVVDRL